MLAFLLPFLGRNWKLIAVGIAILALLAYVKVLHMERDHAVAKYEKEHAAFETYKANAVAMHEAMKSSNAALTLQFKQAEIARNQAAETFRKTINERIKADEASKRIMLPPTSVQLFNSTTTDEPDTGQSPSAHVVNDDAAEARLTLNDLLIISAENNANHLTCINTVRDWQQFWSQFVKNVKQAEAWGGT